VNPTRPVDLLSSAEVPCGPIRSIETYASTPHGALTFPLYPGASTIHARARSASKAATRPSLRCRAWFARFCVVSSLLHPLSLETTFLRLGRKQFELRGPGPADKECLPAAQQVRRNVRVTARVEPDEPGLSSAEVPCGPIRSIETFASTPHGALTFPLYPGASTIHARLREDYGPKEVSRQWDHHI
jgi:hypothetical protein